MAADVFLGNWNVEWHKTLPNANSYACKLWIYIGAVRMRSKKRRVTQSNDASLTKNVKELNTTRIRQYIACITIELWSVYAHTNRMTYAFAVTACLSRCYASNSPTRWSIPNFQLKSQNLHFSTTDCRVIAIHAETLFGWLITYQRISNERKSVIRSHIISPYILRSIKVHFASLGELLFTVFWLLL